MPGISLHQVTRRFAAPRHAPVTAVRDLSLSVRHGECLALLGPSGSGKTTTLRLIAGLDVPDAGEIRIAEHNQAGVPPEARGIAMVFQDHPLLPHLTVEGNLRFILRLRKTPATEVTPLVEDAVRRLDLQPLLPREPATLSGGERQRVALATALVRRPSILLLDEPFAHLDAPLRARLQADLKHLQRALGLTLVFVTHDPQEAVGVADQIAILAQGELRQCGTPAALRHTPADLLVATFLGWPPMNLFRGQLQRLPAGSRFASPEGWAWEFPDPAEVPDLPDHAPVTLGVRPEHLQLFPAPKPANPQARAAIATVEHSESSDGSRVVHMRLHEQAVAVRLPFGSEEIIPAPHAQFRVEPHPDGLHWFDATHGRRLAAQRA